MTVCPDEVRQMRKLWSKVLLQAFQDIVRAIEEGDPHVPTGEGWIGSQSFYQVCEMAGFDGRTISQAFRTRRDDPKFRAAFTHNYRAASRVSHKRTPDLEGVFS